MAVGGEDWQRDVLRELGGNGSASAAPPGADPGDGAASAGEPVPGPDAGGPPAPDARPYSGAAEGTFRIRRAEPARGSDPREPGTPLPPAGVDAPGTDRGGPGRTPPSRQPGASGHRPANPQPGPAVRHPQPAESGVAGPYAQPPHLDAAGALDAIAAARAAAQRDPGAPDDGSGARPARSPEAAPPADSRPATLPELRVPGGRDAAVPMPTPESVPTVDPRLAVALGKPVHGDSVTKRAGRSVRKLGASAAQDVAEETRIGRELQQPVTTGRLIAVTSIRGGVGKTTVAALLARSFNHYRHDPVLALEADGALGTLPVRLGAESVRWSCADLARILTPAMQLTDVTGYLVPIADGGWLLPASQGRLGAPLSMRTYRTVTLALRRYFAVSVVDCETLPGEVARTAMDTAHARVVVAPMTAEGVGGTRLVLDWLAQLPHSALATTVVALTANSPDTTLDLKTATAHLREAGVSVLPVPYDRHLAQGGPIQTALLGRATRRAAVALAAEAMERAVRAR
ncbi:hypothetical protein ABZ829_34570 [Streptomyces xanthochromogenes]|uniref:hypothetical protein n=1 Tax=Streptomyces xanthochromogenes TaxID=67384 RepID=UPI003437566D